MNEDRQSLLARQLRPSKRKRRVSRGQALVEFALFVPLFLFLLVGATDISTLLNNHLDVVYAARAGARVGSVIGKYSPPAPAQYTADCAIIGAVQAALSNSRGVNVSKIAIYQAGSDGQPLNGGAAEDVYPGNAVCNADGTVSPPATQTGWPPTIRSTTPFQEDSIGVAITFSYTYQFNPLGNVFTPAGNGVFQATDYSVMPIEIVIGTPQPTPTP